MFHTLVSPGGERPPARNGPSMNDTNRRGPAPRRSASSQPDAPALRLRGLACAYPGDAGPVHALRGIDLTIARGSFTAIMGPSGSGKTTLLHCSAGLQSPTGGRVELAGLGLDVVGPQGRDLPQLTAAASTCRPCTLSTYENK